MPLHKGGAKSSPTNYRPVSLTSVVCKILESLIKEYTVLHLNDKNLLNKTQHGLTKGRSCLTNLLTFFDDVTKSIDEGFPEDVLYLDFAKAFDKVPHQRLLKKLSAHGIDGRLKEWIANWLQGRKQQVCLNNCLSGEADVRSGVPQGSVLGPILFIVFVNDMDVGLSARILKFADDTKLYLALKDDQAIRRLQDDLNSLCQWSSDWQMLFNIGKCVVLHIGHGNPEAEYWMDGRVLDSVQEAKDLGILVNRSLKPSSQCLAAVKKANKILGMIYRTIEHKSPRVMAKLYKQLIRPHLEYAIQAWSPWLRKDIDLLESVQRRASKMVLGFNTLPYPERLRRLKLTTLELRRERGDVIETFKMLKGFEDLEPNRFFVRNESTHHQTRGHNLKLTKPQCRLDVRKHFFSCRSINPFNALPPRAVSAESVLQFKKAISPLYEGEGATVRL